MSWRRKCDKVMKRAVLDRKREGTMESTAVIQEFRTALGGFNRQDVQDYIEQLAAVHRQELETLQKRLDKAERRTAELEEAMPDAVSAVDREEKAQEALDAASKQVVRLKGELSQSESKLSVARQELERLQAQIAVLEPMASSYREMRDRAANVELDAHHRAQEAMVQARAEAERIAADTRKWMAAVLEQYTQLRRGMDLILEQARTVQGAAERLGPMDEAARRMRELAAGRKEQGSGKTEPGAGRKEQGGVR